VASVESVAVPRFGQASSTVPGTASLCFSHLGEHLGGEGAALACGSGAIEDSIFHWHVLQPAQGTELACFLCVCGSPTAYIPAATQLILSLVDLATSAAANPGPTRANQG
jgi:hypothetical protein